MVQHTLLLCGRHPVVAALRNPRRRVVRLCAGEMALGELRQAGLKLPTTDVVADFARFKSRLPEGVPHQGLVLEVEPLEAIPIEAVLARGDAGPLIFLDQVTDPRNVGAIFRAAAAFGAAALVTTKRHAPKESAVLASAASGGLELITWCRVANLARALDQAAKGGYWRIGLDGAAKTALGAAHLSGPVALVLGAEGAGLRRLTGEHCDELARIPIQPDGPESLNVASAAAVALYEVRRG